MTDRAATLTPPPAVATQCTGRCRAPRPRISVRKLDALFGSVRAVRDVTIDFPDGQVTAIIGPSGCGKSTLLRCLNRMHETVPLTRVKGEVLLDGQNIYARGVNPIEVRRRIGMVFQRPTPFPDDVDPRQRRRRTARVIARPAVAPARGRDRRGVAQAWRGAVGRGEGPPAATPPPRFPAASSSGCASPARSRRDRACSCSTNRRRRSIPLSTQKVEELVHELRGSVTVVIVTHNMQQAARVSDRTAFMLLGELVETAPTSDMFTTPSRSAHRGLHHRTVRMTAAAGVGSRRRATAAA